MRKTTYSKASPSRSIGQDKYFSVRPASSMAEENQVKNFHLFHGNQKPESLMPTNQPQRIELPIFFNTPIRNNRLQVKALNNKSFVSQKQTNLNDTSFTQNQSFQQQLERTMNLRADSLPKVLGHQHYQRLQKTTQMSTFLSSNRRLKDYELLAFACRRAGKQRDEGRAYFSMGILNDNLGNWDKAVDCYKKFLEVCKMIGDVHGEGLAYNCIGVDYQLISDERPERLQDAITYHKKHEESTDINGKFLACINLGLCYDKLLDQKLSLFYYQNALKYAIKMSNLVGQSIAIGNIGKIGTKGLYDNTDKMKIFVEKYIKLAQELQDNKGLIQGHVKLGMISANRGNYFEGKDNFLKALEMTALVSDTAIYNQAKCGFAVSNAECTMDEHLQQFSSNLKYK